MSLLLFSIAIFHEKPTQIGGRVLDEVGELYLGEITEIGVELILFEGALFVREMELLFFIQVLVVDFDGNKLVVDFLVEDDGGRLQKLLDGPFHRLDSLLVVGDEFLGLRVGLFVFFLLKNLHDFFLIFPRYLAFALFLETLELLLNLSLHQQALLPALLEYTSELELEHVSLFSELLLN